MSNIENHPDLSIVTVCLNAASTLNAALISVGNQQSVDGRVEHIIIDGGSTDASLAIIENYAESHPDVRWISEKDNGIADAFNKGIRLASGKIIGFVMADDALADDYVLKDVLSEFDAHKDVDVLTGKLQLGANVKELVEKPGFKTMLLSLFGLKNKMGIYTPHPSTYIKKSVYNQIGLYNIDFKIAMDYEYFLRLRKAGFKERRFDRLVYKMSDQGVSNLKPIDAALESYRAAKMHNIPFIIRSIRLIKTILSKKLAILR